ncbi:MAG: formylglycine-generating enzyme family protein [Mariprofundaceae bacterium]|nr:formylglycine-generating enzyme family protein [Mariprofundaceae bacterium]
MKKTSILLGLLCSFLLSPCLVGAEEPATQKTAIEMITIPSGSFKMGNNKGYGDEKPVHQVSVPSFKISIYEVTQAQWQSVMKTNPSKFKGENLPVEGVNWHSVQDFIQKLNTQTGQKFRLLSEAEWEYAARSGTTTRYSWGRNAIDESRSNCKDCGSQWDRKTTAPVGSFEANPFGVYDMHGNVWEWVQDCWNSDYDDAPNDGRVWATGDCERRVLRGGSWASKSSTMSSSFRNKFSPLTRGSYIGIRLAQDL